MKTNTPRKVALALFMVTSVVLALIPVFYSVVTVNASVPAHLVISELSTRGTNGAYDEFVEIYNPTSSAVDIANWNLNYYAGPSSGWTGTYAIIATFPSGASVPSHGFYLWANSTGYSSPGSGPTPDYATAYNGMADGASGSPRGVRLRDSSNNVIDTVVFEGSGNTSNSDAEGGLTAPNRGTSSDSKSISRKPLFSGYAPCQDTDVNYADFQVLATRTPMNSGSTPIPPAPGEPGVAVSISPNENSGSPGTELTYTVTVTNNGGITDNYNLTNSDGASPSWNPTLDNTSFSNVEIGGIRTTILRVTVPGDADNGAQDLITVTATSQQDGSVTDNYTVTAKAVILSPVAFSVNISPSSQTSLPGGNLVYTVMVKNNGSRTDNYDLVVSDDDVPSWSPTLDSYLFSNVGSGENGTTALRLTVPVNAAIGAQDNITITATSEENNTINDNDSCEAVSANLFTIVALPDTQHYSESYPAIFDNQTNWILQNQNTQNIAFVSHLGDIVETATNISQWQNADHSMRILDNKVLYGILPGNHDLQDTGTNYSLYFPASRFSHWDESYVSYTGNLNSYQLFTAGGMNFIVLDLEYDPPSDVMAWAGNVLDTYSDRRAIISTHAYLTPYGNWSGNGQTIHDNLVVTHINVFLVLCGHSYGAGGYGVYELKENFDGRMVYGLLSDYQEMANGGDGYLRIMTFVPGENTIYVKTYSPWLDSYWTDENNQFELYYPMPTASSVSVSITPSDKNGKAGDNLNFDVAVTNTGDSSDNYSLNLTDTLGWTKGGLPATIGPIASGATWTGQISVIVGDSGTDNLIVTAIKVGDPSVYGRGTCYAHFTLKGVIVSISPSDKYGGVGDNLSFDVTVKNTGSVPDNFQLSLTDSLPWQAGWNAPSQVYEAVYYSTDNSLKTNDDGYVRELYPDNCFENRDPTIVSYNMYVGMENSAPGNPQTIGDKAEWLYIGYSLSSLPAGAVIDNAYLYLLQNYGPSHPLPGGAFGTDSDWVEVWGTENDSWNENTLTWNYKPAINTSLLDNVHDVGTSTSTPTWVSWNVTSFVQNQFTVDNVITLILKSNGVGDNGQFSNNTGWFYQKDNAKINTIPYLQINYHVITRWFENTVSLGPGDNWTGTFWVIVNGVPGDNDNKTVTAISMTDNSVMGSATSWAHSTLENVGVRVAISPSSQGGENGDTLTCAVTVTNTGIAQDNYSLTVADSASWSPSVLPTTLVLASGNSDNATLSVTIPTNAMPGAVDNITVTATSQTDNSIDDGASCLASVVSAGTSVVLVKGWNLICFTALSPTDSPNTIFAPLAYNTDYIMYYWNAPGGPYAGVNPAALLLDNRGYWVDMLTTSKTVSTTGARPGTESISLVKGWDLVGFPMVDATTTPAKIFSPLVYNTDYVMYYWNAPGGPYVGVNPAAALSDNRGYWVDMITTSKTVTVP